MSFLIAVHVNEGIVLAVIVEQHTQTLNLLEIPLFNV